MDSPLIDRLADAKVLVVGDVLIDRFMEGEVTRISREAPVPVFKPSKELRLMVAEPATPPRRARPKKTRERVRMLIEPRAIATSSRINEDMNRSRGLSSPLAASSAIRVAFSISSARACISPFCFSYFASLSRSLAASEGGKRRWPSSMMWALVLTA